MRSCDRGTPEAGHHQCESDGRGGQKRKLPVVVLPGAPVEHHEIAEAGRQKDRPDLFDRPQTGLVQLSNAPLVSAVADMEQALGR